MKVTRAMVDAAAKAAEDVGWLEPDWDVTNSTSVCPLCERVEDERNPYGPDGAASTRKHLRKIIRAALREA